MSPPLRITRSETQKKQSLLRRMTVVHAFFLLVLLVLVSRLIELQIVRGKEYHDIAQAQHYGGVKLPAKRGEIFARDSKTGEMNILATNSTLDLVYVDPLITDNPADTADTLSNILVTEEFHRDCSAGLETCPRELMPFYKGAFDPLVQYNLTHTGSLLEPIFGTTVPAQLLHLPDIVEVRRLFARDIESRISLKRMTFVPLKYSATKVQMNAMAALAIPGITVSLDQKLIYANPEQVPQSSLASISRKIASVIGGDPSSLEDLLVSRPLRYVPVMHRLPPSLSLRIKEQQLTNYKDALALQRQAQTKEAGVQELHYTLRSVAFIPEHWRFYPDGTVASHVVGFLNTNQEAQYGVERTFNAQLSGQEGLISTVSDPNGGQILTADQTIVTPKDGDSIVLTIDRSIQKEVETELADAVTKYKADSGQVIVMDPSTGRILAMANAPLFDSNDYAVVYEKEPLQIDEAKRKQIVVEITDPETNVRVVKAYLDEIFTPVGRATLSEKTQKSLDDLEKLYDLQDIARYYLYLGENLRIEVYPTDKPTVWLKYKNNIGVGAYLNRNVQEIYEPGSVMKAVTMAIALDQGEVTPGDIYDDTGPVKVDEYTIKNALLTYYGKVTMTNCLELSINTCLTSVGFKLGPKLFSRMLEQFGFGHITGVELDDELSGEMKPWKEWSRTLLATTAFGQGISATPLQMITAWGALANGGKLLRPTIIDSVIHPDGTVEKTEPKLVSQPITAQTSETITAMLVSSGTKGFAKAGKVPGYRIAAKTGTSQIAGPGGKYESGTGSTVATFAGYAPVDHPRFLILVKLDRSQNSVFGVVAAAPVFKNIAAFLFKYYGIPPDDL